MSQRKKAAHAVTYFIANPSPSESFVDLGRAREVPAAERAISTYPLDRGMPGRAELREYGAKDVGELEILDSI